MFTLVLINVCVFLASGILMPMKTSNGDPDIASIMYHVSALEQTMVSYQSTFQSNTVELESVKVRLKATEDKLQTSCDELVVVKAKLDSFEKSSNITSIISELQTDVSLEVSLSHGRSGFGGLKFDTVSTDTSRSYSKGSGKFRVPVSGTYLVWANVRVVASHHDKGTDYYIRLLAEENVLAIAYGHTSEDVKEDGIAMTRVVHLEKGVKAQFDMNSTSAASFIMGHGVSSYGATILRRT